MKACIPVAHDHGLASRVYPHFGSAPMFLIVDSETKAVHPISNPDCDHVHGQCRPLDVVAGNEFDAVVVGGIGPGALQRLRSARIPVYLTTSRETVGEALDAIAHGSLAPIVLDDALMHDGTCGHHGGHGHGHGGPRQHRHGRP